MRTFCFFAGDITRCGGTERITVLLANQLATEGHTVHILSISESAEKPYFPLDRRIVRRALFRRSVPFHPALPLILWKETAYLKKIKADAVIDVDVILSAVSIFAAKLSGTRHIAWEHFHYRENLGCRLRDYARRLAKRCSSAVVVLSEYDRTQYLSTPSRAKVVCIPNAVTVTDSAEPDGAEVPDYPFVLSVGRLIHQKGMERIPRLAEEFFATHPGWHWIIAGDGEYRERIEAELRERGLTDRVHLMGWCNPLPYYKKAQFLVMPSRFEGFVLVLLEALACGCPAIAFDCPCGVSEVLRDGVNGCLVPAEDLTSMQQKMAELAENPDVLAGLRANTRKSVEPYSVQNFMQNWRNLLLN